MVEPELALPLGSLERASLHTMTAWRSGVKERESEREGEEERERERER